MSHVWLPYGDNKEKDAVITFVSMREKLRITAEVNRLNVYGGIRVNSLCGTESK